MSAERWYGDALNLKAQGDFCASRNDWRGAYRCYGMAAEHMLKSLYLRNNQKQQLPPELRNAASHDLNFLAEKAGLSQDIAALKGAQRGYWLVVRDYDQQKRYPNSAFPAIEGKDLKLAMLHPTYGIWSWLLSR